MSKTWAVVKREFRSMVHSRMYLFGTLFGPFLIALLIALQFLFGSGGGGPRTLVVVDRTSERIGEGVAETLTSASGIAAQLDLDYAVELARPGEGRGMDRAGLRQLVERDSIDAFLWLPPGLVEGDTAVYVGRRSPRGRDRQALRAAVDEVVRALRLRDSGIDPAVLSRALAPVPFEARPIEPAGAESSTAEDEVRLMTAFFMSFALYMSILLYGNAILRGVREEKEDRIVEILLSSLEPRQLMTGKVFGIGLASLLQISVWAIFGVLALAYGGEVVEALGGRLPDLPSIPASAALTFVAFFAGGFVLYAAIYAALGALATSSQEAQHLQYPAVAPIMIGFLMTFGVVEDPDSTLAVAGTLIPFTSPLVVPVRAAIGHVPTIELLASAALLAAGCAGVLWVAGRVYRVTILASGQRPSLATLWRWARSA